MMHRFSLLLFLIFLSIFPAQAQEAARIILAGNLLDVEHGMLVSNVLIKVEDGIIQEVAPGADRKDYEDIIDLSAYTAGQAGTLRQASGRISLL